MNQKDRQARTILKDIARRALLARGLHPDFSQEAQSELGRIRKPPVSEVGVRDLRGLNWASIDNDDSLDIDQLTVAAALKGGETAVLVAVADVDSLVKKGSALDMQAQSNTTSIYTAAQNFPMLPERLSNDLTSLNLNQDRLAVVVEMVIGADGSLRNSDVYRALVRNHAQLSYNAVAAWLNARMDTPPEIAAVEGLDENLRLQDRVAQALRAYRHSRGALCLETIEARAVFEGEAILEIRPEEKNRAKDIIENFMIEANGVTVRYLSGRGFPSIRRQVRVPKRWDRIVEIAAQLSFKLPKDPDPKALETFLVKEKNRDPLRFPDLSLAVIKLLGNGEYVAEFPGEKSEGHFGLAVRDYTHSTAPNRRYPDLITQRLLKAAIEKRPVPYTKRELDELAAVCTEKEDAATKVERQVGKSAAALLLQSRIGEQFEAIVTGASAKGTWVRLLQTPVEGMLKEGSQGVDVGDRLRVRLISVDVDQGFIDFEKA